jgi:hypothetical protein
MLTGRHQQQNTELAKNFENQLTTQKRKVYSRHWGLDCTTQSYYHLKKEHDDLCKEVSTARQSSTTSPGGEECEKLLQSNVQLKGLGSNSFGPAFIAPRIALKPSNGPRKMARTVKFDHAAVLQCQQAGSSHLSDALIHMAGRVIHDCCFNFCSCLFRIELFLLVMVGHCNLIMSSLWL